MTERGLLDTSVVIDFVGVTDVLPAECAISALTLAELSAGPHATDDLTERAVRQQRLAWAEGTFHALPFDVEAARTFGRVYAAVRAAGRKPRGRAFDLQIAAVALSNGLALYTRNPDDLHGLEDLLEIVTV